MDEMQSGFGRTGKKFAFEHYSFVPDIICCGKGMGSGMPISGLITSTKIMNIPDANLQSTHSGNPLSCAAGTVTLDEIKRLKLIKISNKKGKLFHKHLNKIKNMNLDLISFSCGKGLIGALIFKKYKKIPAQTVATTICKLCLQQGLLLVNTNRDSIKFGPPLTIKLSDINKSMKILSGSIERFKKNCEN